MSTINRLEWSRQVALLNDTIKTFQADPSPSQLEAAIRQMQSYAEAARLGGIEIPQRFTVN
ncbi:hypothetical protein [Rugamonas rubra]|uniref:Uncharacterized protein n=1 Tax=Rugamonas rubra TaxID=758825 RepID=A0A1I4JP21_9BURK|nr:hypothetical protein [Rugamonas rubra]SFL68041.1 hypothetical protein SAMN02982985_01120 [Rugamonas rubra]